MNRVYIEAFKRTSLSSGESDFIVDIMDEYDSTTLCVAENDIPEDNLELLKKVILWQNQEHEHGSCCEVIERILASTAAVEKGIHIGNEFYDYEDIKTILSHSYRNVYACPGCGWESFDDDCDKCPRCIEEPSMAFSRVEEYEK